MKPSALRYAAAFASTLDQPDLYTGFVNDLASTVGLLMEVERIAAKDTGRDFWPIDGAEAGAIAINNVKIHSPDDAEELAKLRVIAVTAAMRAGLSAGNMFRL